MARAGLRLSQAELARRAGVSPATLTEFEKGTRSPYERTIRDIQKALENAGAIFTPEGVDLRKGE
ncbi:helix-turn-helix domain-containing protein [Acidocella sp.]|uniref:helix-turn-helix domain-containing protein n=1 Tax=Acidocella sp. TaxID=50710 RepID=UPI003D020BE6